MVAVPAEMPVINPVVALMVTTAGFDEFQVPPVPVTFSVLLDPMQMLVVPLIVPAFGAAVTVTGRVAETGRQPPVPVTV